MRKRTLEDLEFNEIIEMIRSKSLSEEGKALINENAITSDRSLINERARRIEEIETLSELSEEPLRSFVSLKNLLEYADHTHAAFDGVDIFLAGDFLVSMRALAHFLRDESLLDSELEELQKDIDIAISQDGAVKESHPLLVPLYKRVEEARNVRAQYSQSFLSEHSTIVQNQNALYRNERIVLPIKRESKGLVPGYIQGSSQSGGTLFVETFELVEMNNNVVLAEEEIMHMKHKILNDLSVRIREKLWYFRKNIKFVADFDFHYSLYRFIKKTKSRRVNIDNRIKLVNARHPLLFEKAVPISLELDNNCRGVVLSGANAGGKTVTMKTVALFSLLNQLSGYAPVDEGSTLPLFDNVYTDIGDGQSILENFSTFSGHMANVSRILSECTEKSLVLLDEIGSGTDPSEGAALTIGILEYLKKKRTTVFVTSHYSQVKMYAYNDEEMLNAGMEFDVESSRPTYRIIPGLPADSHALAIAKRMGLPKEVLSIARENLGEGATVSQLINELTSRNRALDRKIGEVELEKRRYLKSQSDNEKTKSELEKLRHEIKSGSADELRAFMKETRRELEKLVMDVTTGKINREKTMKVKSFIKTIEAKSKSADEEVEKEDEKLSKRVEYDFSEGMEVYCGAFKRRGILLKNLGKGKWQVSLDSLRMTLSEKDLEPAKSDSKPFVAAYKTQAPKPKLVLDLRGYTLKEALEAVQNQIEGCLVHSLFSFSIIHGIGNGVLNHGIHDYLKKDPNVEEYYFATPQDGGTGKTYVKLK
ncbi:MAG: Smr/MutS family protein [Sphaerochaetaceae bacterium]|nr:Smr/MutS family protein [Sphaerochaetaceae bacterium]